VSRGLISSTQNPTTGESLYLRQDVEKVKARSLARSGHGPVAAAALHWGEPVLRTAITEITPEGPRYRAHLALDLAKQGYSFEAACDYLWSGALDPGTRWWNEPAPMATVQRMIATLLQERPDANPLQLLT